MTKLLASCVLAILTLALAPQPLKAGPLCPLLNATKHGTYVVHATGNIVGVGPAVGVGEITYDGHGNSLANFTLNLNGTVHTFTAVSGTYTINSDCTGTHVEGGSHYSFVVSPNGNNATWIETDPGAVITGTEVRLNPVEDFEARLRQENNRTAPANLRRSRKARATLEIKTAGLTR
jgi:hypothetical protein